MQDPRICRVAFVDAGERSLNEVAASEADQGYRPGFRLQAEQVLGAWRGQDTGAATIDGALRRTEFVACVDGIADR